MGCTGGLEGGAAVSDVDLDPILEGGSDAGGEAFDLPFLLLPVATEVGGMDVFVSAGCDDGFVADGFVADGAVGVAEATFTSTFTKLPPNPPRNPLSSTSST